MSFICILQTTEVISELEGKINHYKQLLEDLELQRKRDLRVSQTFVIILCYMVLGNVRAAINWSYFCTLYCCSWMMIPGFSTFRAVRPEM